MQVEFEEFTVFGDIEGRYETFKKIVDRCPHGPIVSVGDAHDRCKMSREVLEAFLMNPDYYMVQSNHTHLLLDFCNGSRIYDGGTWLQRNGGKQTLFSYGMGRDEVNEVIGLFEEALYSTSGRKAQDEFEKRREELAEKFKILLGPEMLNYLKNLPMFIEGKDFIITHAPISPNLPLVTEIGKDPDNNVSKFGYQTDGIKFLWNTGKPVRRDKFQIHGHCSRMEVTWWTDEKGKYGVNMDSSINALSAMHWPSRELFIEELGLSYD